MFDINRPGGSEKKSVNSKTQSRMDYKLQQFDLLKTVGKGGLFKDYLKHFTELSSVCQEHLEVYV